MSVTTAQRAAVAAEAKRIGLAHYPYQFAGAGPKAFDCSGLVVAAWAKVKVALPHNTSQLAKLTGIVPPSAANVAKLLPGDLLYYYGTVPDDVTHVGVFLEFFAGMRVIAQATDTEHGSEVIRCGKYVNPTGLGFVQH